MSPMKEAKEAGRDALVCLLEALVCLLDALINKASRKMQTSEKPDE